MMRLLARSFPVLLISVIALTPPTSGQLQDGSSDRDVTPAQYEQWKLELSNWGRWGEDGEIGALNLITPEKRLEAVALVQEGFSVSLASDANTVQAVDNPRPYEHEMLSISSDRIAVRYHGITHTHIDALAHINDGGTWKPSCDSPLQRPRIPGSVESSEAGPFARYRPHPRGRREQWPVQTASSSSCAPCRCSWHRNPWPPIQPPVEAPQRRETRDGSIPCSGAFQVLASFVFSERSRDFSLRISAETRTGHRDLGERKPARVR